MASWYGVAGWFCCGGAYGPCGPAGGGSCGTCESSQYHCAWPKLNRPGYPYCDYTACNYPMEEVYCDQLLIVVDVCNNLGVGVNVKDCGPDMALFCGDTAPDCSPPGYYDRIVDLTPAAFSAMAPLDQGLLSCRVDV